MKEILLADVASNYEAEISQALAADELSFPLLNRAGVLLWQKQAFYICTQPTPFGPYTSARVDDKIGRLGVDGEWVETVRVTFDYGDDIVHLALEDAVIVRALHVHVLLPKALEKARIHCVADVGDVEVVRFQIGRDRGIACLGYKSTDIYVCTLVDNDDKLVPLDKVKRTTEWVHLPAFTTHLRSTFGYGELPSTQA